MNDIEVEAVLSFWFVDDAARRKKLWWGKDAALDREIADRFAPLRARAAAGELTAWESAPRSRLALIILVDQFSRNMFRGDPRAFEHDPLARRWCVDGLVLGHDRQLSTQERMFFYLPLEHSESLADQERSVTLFTALGQEDPDTDVAEYARRHRDIVARFGRFPHRNAALGRASTDEEREFLRQPGSSF